MHTLSADPPAGPNGVVMSRFSDAELAYLREGRKLGRLATIDGTGLPHLVPLGWRYNPDRDTIDIGGHNFTQTRKFRNVQDNPHVAFLVDDLASVDPWRPRAVMVRGTAEALEAEEMIRITPAQVVSWGV